MQLPALPPGIDGRTWLVGIIFTRLPQILIALAVLVTTCHPNTSPHARGKSREETKAYAVHIPSLVLVAVADPENSACRSMQLSSIRATNASCRPPARSSPRASTRLPLERPNSASRTYARGIMLGASPASATGD